jgi:proteic killer suppression protein
MDVAWAIPDAVIIHRVIRSFAEAGTENIFNGVSSRRARAARPAALWPVARRKLTQLNRVRDLREFAVPPGNRLERLRGDWLGQHSIRITDQYRVCFRWEAGHADEVEITDYH